MRLVYREKGEAIPNRVLYPYPLPQVLGLTLDPQEKVRVLEVAAGSSAERDGLKAGDDVTALEGQPLVSIADVQWVLHNAGDDGQLRASVHRDGKTVDLALMLEPGWRRRGDISWRATSWDLRRMTTGGMRLDNLSTEDRAKLGLADNALALSARHVGEYGAHAAAKNAGFRKRDVLIAVDGKTGLVTESQLMAWLVNAKLPGEKVPVVVLRDGNKFTLNLPMQ
jgi:S1-C subfamily serine protease